MVSYPYYDWIVFVSEEFYGYAYSYSYAKFREVLDKRSFCGGMDLLVLKGTEEKKCSSNLGRYASALQKGAMRDAVDYFEALDLMVSREYLHGLEFDLILTYKSGWWDGYFWSSFLGTFCSNEQIDINGMTSLWIGNINKKY
jgi:hypothetical protein